MRLLIIIVFLISFFAIPPSHSKEEPNDPKVGVVPKNGFVPDLKTAEKVADAILNSIYGEENIRRQKPFQISLKEDVWCVRGVLQKGHRGGTAEIWISKRNAKILYVYHGK